jgi:hypothetical protein
MWAGKGVLEGGFICCILVYYHTHFVSALSVGEAFERLPFKAKGRGIYSIILMITSLFNTLYFILPTSNTVEAYVSSKRSVQLELAFN